MLSKHSYLLEDVPAAKEYDFTTEHENPEFLKAAGDPICFRSDFSKLTVIHRVRISSAFK
jgi:hypothetical protein